MPGNVAPRRPPPAMIILERICRRTCGDFSLEVDLRLPGPVTGLFGSSGAGKTTLVELLAGLRRPHTGRLLLDGTVLDDTAARVHVRPEFRRIGYVAQDTALFPHLSVEENLRYGFRPGRKTDDDNDHRFSIDHICDLLGIAHLRTARVPGLSGGERQRISLARALLSFPRLLLLDEPLASLDASRKEAILPYLRRVRDEFALPMLYVSHAPEEMMALCDEILVLEAGRVVSRGAPAEIFEPVPTPCYRLRRRDQVVLPDN